MPTSSGLFNVGIPVVSGSSGLLDSGQSQRIQADRLPANQSFGSVLQNALGEVNKLQSDAGAMVQKFALGGDVDVHQVMIAMEQASTAMALTVQVRNKMVEAYQEIIRTPV